METNAGRQKADVVADAVLSAFAHGGAFRPKNVNSDSDKDGNPIVEITDTCWVVMPGAEPPEEPPEDEGPSEAALGAWNSRIPGFHAPRPPG